MDIGGSLIGGLAVEALVSAAKTLYGRSPWGGNNDRITYLGRLFEPTADGIAVALANDLERNGIARSQQSQIATLLRRPETSAWLRQAMLAAATGQNAEYSADLQAQLTSLLILFTELPEPACEAASPIVCRKLQEGFRSLFEGMARDQAPMLAMVQDQAWNQLLLESLRSISQAARFYREYRPEDFRSFQQFERLYRNQVHSRHRFIAPPHLDYVQRALINRLFVPPDLERAAVPEHDSITSIKLVPVRLRRAHDDMQYDLSEDDDGEDLHEGKDTVSVSLDDLKRQIHRAVVLGDPGGGKSTLAQKLTYDLSSRTKEIHICPIHVVLRDYAKLEADKQVSLLQFIESRAASQYQVEPPPGAIEYLLISGKAFVILDGLDELIDTSRRSEVVGNVESFSNRYPNVPILVTSRRVGYREAPLDPNIFEIIELGQFNTEAVAEYSQKWFRLDSSRPKDERNALAASFLSESRQIADLCSNPLLLALLCNIYRAENYIPSSRAEVYRICATMLFEKWDSRRGIRVDLPYKPYLDPAIKYLAFWIYSDEKLQSGITEAQLVQRTVNYLCPARIEDPEEATTVAEAFIGFCKGRAWVFTDTGTTPSGQALYQFTHRTFLEYFTAAYLVRTEARPNDLWNALKDRIIKEEWDVVAQIALQMQEAQQEGAAAEFTSLLLHESIQQMTPDEVHNLLVFAARSLNIVVPGDGTVRQIVSRCLDHLLSYETDARPWGILQHQEDILWNILQVRNDNSNGVIRGVLDYIDETITTASDAIAARGATVALALPHMASDHPRGVGVGSQSPWSRVRDSLVSRRSERMRSLSATSMELTLSLYREGIISLTEAVSLQGVEVLFAPLLISNRQYSLKRRVASVAEQYLSSATRIDATTSPLVGEMARLFRDRSAPYVSRDSIWLSSTYRPIPGIRPIIPALRSRLRPLLPGTPTVGSRRTGKPPRKVGPDELFVGFMLLAIMSEMHIYRSGGKRENLYAQSLLGSLDGLRLLFIARDQGQRDLAVEANSLLAMLDPGDAEIARSWTAGIVDFVEGIGSSRTIDVSDSRL